MGIRNIILNRFINKPKKAIKKAAGVCVLYRDNILLVRVPNTKKKGNAYGIPKGGIHFGENYLDAAIRELREETGIYINPRDIHKEINVANSYNIKGEVRWQLYYYTYIVEDLSDIGMSSLEVNRSNLQLEEIDWAGFIKISKAYEIINRSQLIILDRTK